ncbi:MAG: exodeoxyribonuclease V subunit alpha [Deltaproteobacteria bacterium]|nr:exodeoxyribonuclease V subunit alpha [Deltaproteobacteria bacterium]
MTTAFPEPIRERAPRDPRGTDPIERARRAGVLSALDVQFAERLAALFGESDRSVVWAVALACRQESLGHVCADLPRLCAEGLASEEGAPGHELPALLTHASVEAWLAALASSPLVESPSAAVADGAPVRPLVLDGRGRLHLRRLDRAERALAAAILRRAQRADLSLAGFDAEARIEALVGSAAKAAAEKPKRAAAPGPARTADATPDPAPRRALALGLTRPLALLTGGPGTGKTTLVARIVRLLADQALATGGRPPRILLLAPTGKAAAAMAASFARERAAADLPEALRTALPSEAETLHRALARVGSRRARGGRPAGGFDADVVVVDETSMVDLEQMARLFEACEAVPRLILLGDPRQLASVEAGAVLADLCGEGSGADGAEEASPPPAIAGSIVRLTRSHRYAETGGIGRLAEAVRAGDADAALAILADASQPEVERCGLASPAVLVARLGEEVARLQAAVAAELLPDARLARLGDYRVLCAHRAGPFGVEALSRILDEAAARERHASTRMGEWPGRLVLVTRNAPAQSLWNGDVGLVERLPEGLRALFSDPKGGVRTLSLARLPAHESAIAMSVHKSQGSEFKTVDLVLAPHATRLMTRELLYTGITRARERLRIHASEEVLRAAIARRARRDSGLADRLREAVG